MAKQIDILAVDDEQVILDSIVKLCSSEGWSVDTSLDAIAALKKIDHNDYRLIISDIMMPEMDGFEFLLKLHKNDLDIPVIMTTGYSTVQNAVKSLYTGAIDFLPKPFTMDELISSVSRGLRYREIQKHLKNPEKSEREIYFVPCPAKYSRLGYASWALLQDDGSVKVGATDLFLELIEIVQEIQLMEVENEIIQGNTCAHFITNDSMEHFLLAPLSGRIIERNEKILKNTSLMEKDPYFSGWLYTIIPSDLDYESKHLIPCTSEGL